MLVLPADAAMYGLTAAVWYRLPVASSPQFQVIVPPGTVPRRRPGLEPHEGLRPDDVAVHRGLRVTTPERTWLDLSLTLRDAELVVAGDAMVRLGLTTPERLIAAADSERRRRGIVRARRLARLIREGTDSPPESVLRFLLVDAGLPCPTVNPTINDEHGQWIGRPDLAYERLKIAIQYEGDIHRTDRRRWRSDIARDEVMRANGWEVIRVTSDDLARPWRLYRRIRAAEERQRSRVAQTRP